MAPVPTNLLPPCSHSIPRRMKIQAAPALLLSRYPPTTAVLPSPDSDTEDPCDALPTAPMPTNLAACVHMPPTPVNAQAAPVPPLSFQPPMIAVLPSADRATEDPCCALPTAAVPTNLAPCCVHTPPTRLNTQAAPAPLLSLGPPTMAVLPSDDRATEVPCSALPTAPVPSSLPPCCVH